MIIKVLSHVLHVLHVFRVRIRTKIILLSCICNYGLTSIFIYIDRIDRKEAEKKKFKCIFYVYVPPIHMQNMQNMRNSLYYPIFIPSASHLRVLHVDPTTISSLNYGEMSP